MIEPQNFYIAKEYGKFYVSGNIVDGNPEVTADNWAGGVQVADAAVGSEDAAPAGDAPAPSASMGFVFPGRLIG